VELDEKTVDLLAQYGPEIIGKVNLLGTSRAEFSLGAAAGWEVYRKEQRSVGSKSKARI